MYIGGYTCSWALFVVVKTVHSAIAHWNGLPLLYGLSSLVEDVLAHVGLLNERSLNRAAHEDILCFTVVVSISQIVYQADIDSIWALEPIVILG